MCTHGRSLFPQVITSFGQGRRVSRASYQSLVPLLMLPPLPRGMGGSIRSYGLVSTVGRAPPPGVAGASVAFPLVVSNLISGPLGPSGGRHHCLAPRVLTPLVLRLYGGPCPLLPWRA